MIAIFRTDASFDIGSGHVMRCLTLADALKAEGADCFFVCRAHKGHLFDLIIRRGYRVIALPVQSGASSDIVLDAATKKTTYEHTAWLGTDWVEDSEQTKAAIADMAIDWIVVDHYAIDAQWENALKPFTRYLMVIDDLADREHGCNILLDQNFVQGMEARYKSKVPNNCVTLIGPQYALLRPEFVALRQSSMARRQVPELDRLLVFMGGSDPDNETCKAMAAIKLSSKSWKRIDVVVGQDFPALPALTECLESIPVAMLHIQTPDMAQLLVDADLAITAGGSVTWEKCVLGVPSLVLILGENQRQIAMMMHNVRAQRTIGNGADVSCEDLAKALNSIDLKDLTEMTCIASQICDGLGAGKVVKAMLSLSNGVATSLE